MPVTPTSEDPDTGVAEVSQQVVAGFVEQSRDPTMALDRDLRFVFANEAYCKSFGVPKEQLIGQFVFEVFELTPEVAASFRTKWMSTFEGKRTRSDVQKAVVKRRDGTTKQVHWQSTQEPFFGPDGQVQYVVQRVENVTHLVELQKSHDVIAAELDHRVKNFVSVILATARITSASATSVEQYTEDFCARIDSMARVYSRMSSLGLKGLELKALFEDELAQIASHKAIRYALKGDDIQLSVKSTRDGGMIIHEFVTNALKHGCFSRPEGRLDVEWSVSGNLLNVRWVESGLTGVKPPEKIGFGTRLTEMLPNAKVTREYNDTGLTIEYIVPIELVVEDAGQGESREAAS
ncbi:PAS domain-containing protein [uncultured Hyphomonas sp.]|uniref:sensor histidine kinase n=1 Tax=uncultured Hyphomonas sp. TaxID=225298 RepID=UPI002AABDF62|nr:PAS domain-containing protein [uncultured Hyphomonas sp.]